MAARALDEILRELDASYNPQRQSLQTRIDALPAQADAEIEGLKATQSQAFDDILGGARSRGLGFSGIPLGEQAKYTATTFLPAVARVRQSQNETRQSLFDALNNVNLQQNQYAQSLRQGELDRDEQIRQFNEQMAEQRRQAAQQASSNAWLQELLDQYRNGTGEDSERQSLDSIFGPVGQPSSAGLLGGSLASRLGGPSSPKPKTNSKNVSIPVNNNIFKGTFGVR